MSLINYTNRSRPKRDPCGTPPIIVDQAKELFTTTTH